MLMATILVAPDVTSTSQIAPNVWIVPLPRHPLFDHVRLKRVFSGSDSRHRVVVVDSARLLACADRDQTDYVLKPVPEWHPGKINGIRAFLDPAGSRVPEMPYVTFTECRASGLLGLLGLQHEGVVAFRNGQHRARYLAYAGALSFPVEVHEREAQALIAYCGYRGDPEDAASPVDAAGDTLSR
jgi:hypothetical protein